MRFNGADAVFTQPVSFSRNVAIGGSNTFVATVTSQLTASEGILIADDKKIFFGTGKDASIEYDEDNTNKLIASLPASGGRVEIPDDVAYALEIKEGSNSYVAFSSTDGSERLLVSKQIRITDDTKLAFGNAADATIEYDENGTDELRFSGAAVTFEQVATFGASVTATGFVAAALSANATAINNNTTIPANYNSVMYGPITINDIKTLTISAGTALKIIDISEL